MLLSDLRITLWTRHDPRRTVKPRANLQINNLFNRTQKERLQRTFTSLKSLYTFVVLKKEQREHSFKSLHLCFSGEIRLDGVNDEKTLQKYSLLTFNSKGSCFLFGFFYSAFLFREYHVNMIQCHLRWFRGGFSNSMHKLYSSAAVR